jgi:hypothetical protein
MAKKSHPFLFRCGKQIVRIPAGSVPAPGLVPIQSTRHHLYPKHRKDIKDINKERFKLRLWEHRHGYWNQLFQFCYQTPGSKHKHCSELSIDDIIVMLICRHPFILQKSRTTAWKLLFGNKNLEEVIDLLCRALSFKYNAPVRRERYKETSYPETVRYACMPQQAA